MAFCGLVSLQDRSGSLRPFERSHGYAKVFGKSIFKDFFRYTYPIVLIADWLLDIIFLICL